MSETTEAPRNDVGQFTPDTSNMVGAELANAEMGFRTRPRDEPAIPDYSDGDPVREAAANLVAKRAQPIEIQPDDAKEIFGKPDVTEAVTAEQAAKDLASRRQGTSQFVEGHNLQQFAEGLDKARGEELKNNPRAADDLGLSAADVEAAKKADVPDDAKADPMAIRPGNDAAADTLDSVEGLDPETKAAMRLPQVREALEKQFGEIDRVTQEYSTGLENARVHTLASLAEVVPHLAGLPPAQFEQGLAVLAQVNPPAFQQAMNILGRAHTITQAQQQEQQRQAQLKHQEFEGWRQQYSRASDEALGPMTMAEKHEMVEDLVNYVGEFGISREQFAREASTNLALHHPAFQRMAADAVRYQRLVKAPKAVPQSLPAVQRPGVSRDTPRVGDNSSKISALQRQLEGAKGERAARIAGQIRSLKRGA